MDPIITVVFSNDATKIRIFAGWKVSTIVSDFLTDAILKVPLKLIEFTYFITADWTLTEQLQKNDGYNVVKSLIMSAKLN